MITLNDFTKLMFNKNSILVYTEYEEEWEEGEFKDEFGDLEGYAGHIFTVKGEALSELYLKEKYANAKIFKASIYDGGIIRVWIKLEE